MNTEHAGKKVIVKKNQTRIGGAKYPGRTGVVIRANSCDANLLHVKLDPTASAKETVTTFWLKELEFVDSEEGPATMAQEAESA